MEATMLAVTKRALPALIAAVALSAPATAAARPNLDPVTATSGEAQSGAAHSAAVSSSEEFHWGDAGLGAVGALALIGGAGAGSLALRRRRLHA
jgi:hypothetical protein